MKWRHSGTCWWDGPREEQNDEKCNQKVDRRPGYCECGNGEKKMKKGCNPPSHFGFPYETCQDACTGKG